MRSIYRFEVNNNKMSNSVNIWPFKTNAKYLSSTPAESIFLPTFFSPSKQYHRAMEHGACSWQFEHMFFSTRTLCFSRKHYLLLYSKKRKFDSTKEKLGDQMNELNKIRWLVGNCLTHIFWMNRMLAARVDCGWIGIFASMSSFTISELNYPYI